jgi:two-component system cell cycle sensor histidine kinase PleC
MSTRLGEADKTVINRQRAERRREVARTIRDQRERLTSTSGTRPAFDYELALSFARNRVSAAYAMPLLALLVAATAWLWVDAIQVTVWLIAVLGVLLLSSIVCRRFMAAPQGSVSISKWVRRFILIELLQGLVWSAILAFSWLAPMSPGLDVFQFSVAIVVISVGTMLSSTVPGAAMAGTAPVVAAAAVAFVSRNELLYYAMAVLAIGAEGFFLLLSGRFYSATLAALESRAEKESLIAELETANAISDEARRRAEEANLAKSRFLATMSHELRTPLNAILGFSEVMKGEVLGPIDNANYKDYARDIHASGEHLLNLINEILDLSRIEAGRYKLHEEPVNLAHLVEECHHLVQLKARNKDISVAVNAEADLPRIWADARAVRQVVLNLLSNAVKFTQPGGKIEVRVGWTSGGGQYVSVADNGPGIPEEEIPIVLSAFGQGSIAITAAEDGTGLGLPIVQALMHTHDGKFELTSKLREGTTATAIFPKSRVMEALPPIDNDSLKQVS